VTLTESITVDDKTFKQAVLEAKQPVLVDFWAQWCGPCRTLAPTLDALADEYAGRVKVGKVDVDQNGATAMRYHVRSIPTLLLFKGGQVVDQQVGALGKAGLEKMLAPHVAV
jgi:thioredoxin 1